jgi:hypothetical protein
LAGEVAVDGFDVGGSCLAGGDGSFSFLAIIDDRCGADDVEADASREEGRGAAYVGIDGRVERPGGNAGWVGVVGEESA